MTDSCDSKLVQADSESSTRSDGEKVCLLRYASTLRNKDLIRACRSLSVPARGEIRAGSCKWSGCRRARAGYSRRLKIHKDPAVS